MRKRDVKRSVAGKRRDLVESDAAEAENSVARGVGLRDSDVAGEKRILERVDAFLGVVGHHRKVGGGRRRGGGDIKSGAGVSGEEPGGEDGAAAAPVEVLAAGILDAAEELVGEVEAAGEGLGLDGEGRDRVGARFEWLVGVAYRFGE